MKTKTVLPSDKLVDDGSAPERGYAAWKEARIVRAQAQARDRSAMIDGDTVWKRLSCDD